MEGIAKAPELLPGERGWIEVWGGMVPSTLNATVNSHCRNLAEGDRAPDVCLVSMPYASLVRPSMALGLLQGILQRDNIATMSIYANVWFAERVGLRLYDFAMNAPTVYLMGEWTFAESAFPETRSRERDEHYLSQIKEGASESSTYDGDTEALIVDLRSLRAAATEFVDETARRILATGARVIGCTSTFEQHVPSLALLRRIHELDPTIITMMGGANCETTMGAATHRSFPWVDYVVSGEADNLITPLCRLALDRGRAISEHDLPPGVLGPCHRASRLEPQQASQETPRAMFGNLDSLPVPEFGDYFRTLAQSPLRTRIKAGLPLETSRGCWWGAKHHCTFCGLNGSSMAFRSKSPDRVLSEITALEERHGIDSFEVVDNILDMGYFTTLLPRLVEQGGRRRFFYEVKANLSRQQLKLMAQAGITYVQPGIESLHSDVLHLMNKGVHGWQNIQLLKWSRELGIRLSWSLLWGFPGEKDEYYQQMAEWIPFLEHLQPPGGMNRLRYDRYSVYHQQAQQFGLVLFPIPAMSYVYPVVDRELNELAYFFTTEPSRHQLEPFRELPEARSGISAVQEAIGHWSAAFHGRTPPVLSMMDRGGVLDVVDTRQCAHKARQSFKDLERAVLLVSDTAPRPNKLAGLVARAHGLAATEQEVTGVVSRLVAEGLIIRMDDRLIGLPVLGTGTTMPADFPGGTLRA